MTKILPIVPAAAACLFALAARAEIKATQIADLSKNIAEASESEDGEGAFADEFERVISESRKADVSVTAPQALLYHGLQLAQDEEYEDAIPFLEEAIKRDPTLTAGWEGLGWSYIRTSQPKRARDLWLRMRDLMPEKPIPHALIAQYEILERNWAAADKSFRRSLAINPRQYDLRYSFAQNLLRLGETDEAIAVMRSLVKEDPDRIDIELSLAQTYASHFRDEEALAIYRRISDEMEGNEKFMLERAVLELRAGELRTADQICLDILSVNEANDEAMRMRADIAEISGQEDITPLLELVEATTNETMRGDLRLRLAARCIAINRKEKNRYSNSEIISHLRKSTKENPHNVDTFLLLAARLMDNRDYVSCRSVLEEVLTKYNRFNVNALSLLFELEMALGYPEAAEKVLRDRFMHFDRSDPMIHYYRARVLTAKGEYPEAMAEAKKLEEAGSKCAVFSLRYAGLTESDWVPETSVRRLAEHIRSLQQAGWDLVSPAEIPALIEAPGTGENKKGNRRRAGRIRMEDEEEDEEPPITAKVVDYVGWLATGSHMLDRKKKVVEEEEDEEYADVDKRFVFTISFDTARRSSMVLGDQIASEFGVPFALFTSTQPSEQYEPARLGWEEIRAYAANGNWLIGSGLVAADIKEPIDKEGLDYRAPLANRLWVKDRNRVESMNEWDRRIRREFRESRRVIREEMGTNDCPVAMVSYPYGTVGQAGACNIKGSRSVSDSIISEAASSYSLGFVNSQSGFTVPGDDPLITRRYEPNWADEGEDVVRHAFEYHPYFLGRRIRAEIAMLMNHPTEANELVASLRKEGYPDNLCQMLETNLRSHFRNKPVTSIRPLLETATGGSSARATEQTDEMEAERRRIEDSEEEGGKNRQISKLDETDHSEWRFSSAPDTPWFNPGYPFVQGDISYMKANDQIETLRYGVKAGFNWNDNLGFYGDYHRGEIRQTVRPYWNARTMTGTPYRWSNYDFRVETEEIRVGFNWRLESGVFLFGSFGVAYRRPDYTWKYTTREESLTEYDTGLPLSHWRKGIWRNLQDPRNSGRWNPMEDNHQLVYTLGARWSPRDNLSFTALFDHDYVSSAAKALTYNSIAIAVDWLPTDTWKIDGRMQYWSYSDNNAMYYARIDSLWNVEKLPEFWYGIRLSTVTTSEPSDLYWTPYWEKRIMGILRYQYETDEYAFRVDFLGGYASNDGRGTNYLRENADMRVIDPEYYMDDENYGEDGYDPEGKYVSFYDKGTNWKPTWGFSGMYSRRITRWLTLALECDVLALRSYIDYSVQLMIMLHL